MATIKRWFFQLDLFPQPRPNTSNEDVSGREISLIVTRAYLIILTVILSLLAFTFWIPYNLGRTTLSSPSLYEYQQLSSDTICSCSKQSISFNTFLVHNVSFHQICSSELISDLWISSLYFAEDQTKFDNNDFRKIGFSFFQTLSMLCRISKHYVQETLSKIYSEIFFSEDVLSPTAFKAQIIDAIDHFRTEDSKFFQTRMEVISILISGSSFLNGLSSSIRPFIIWFARNSASGDARSIHLIQEDGSICYCITSSSCETPIMKIYASNHSQTNISWTVPGFKQRCMPMETSFHSTLECFYNQTCIDTIVSYLSNSSNPKAMDSSLSSRFEITSKVEELAFQLMIEDWGFESSYENYFNQCMPKLCSYVTTARPTLLQTVGYLIGLLSGLCSGLRIVMMIMIRLIQRHLHSRTATIATTKKSAKTQVKRKNKILISLQNALLRLNLFKTPNMIEDDEIVIHHQKLVTRLYLVLLIVILIIITFYTAISKQNLTKTIKNPSELTYFLLESKYAYSLHCPCSEISVDYGSILIIEPLYYAICTSDLISSAWIQVLRDNYRPPPLLPVGVGDFLSIGAGLFQSLAVLCQTAMATINKSLQIFLRRPLVTAQLLSKQLVDAQFKVAIDQWRNGITYDLSQTIDLFRAHTQGNQLLSNNYNFKWHISYDGTIYFFFSSFYHHDVGLASCSCALSSQCNGTLSLFVTQTEQIEIEGLKLACASITSLTLSDLRLFYNRSAIDWLFGYLVNNPSRYLLNPLDSNNQSFPNETIQSIINQSFVKQWFIDVSFSNYYHSCAPQTCSYQIFHRPDFTSIGITMISVFGGLSTSLKILMQLLLLLLRKYQTRCSHRVFKTWLKNFFDHQRLAIRLKFALITLSLATLYFLYAYKKYDQIQNIATDPSYEFYLNITREYSSDSLQCPCSQASIPHESFMNISVVSYHQICSKPFLKSEWLEKYFPRLITAVYQVNSFDDLIPTYFQMIAEFCDVSRKTIENQLSMFLANFLIGSFPNPSPTNFQLLIQEKIDRFKMNSARSVMRVLELLQETAHVNQLMTIFSSNWYFGRATVRAQLNSSNYSNIDIFPTRYGTCDCGLSKSCIVPMINNDGMQMTGFMVGCYPLQALLKSTFECLYERSCFQLIKNVSYQPFNVPPLLLNVSLSSRFSMNSTVQQIFDELFVETWSISISYERYYAACAPSSCTYSILRSSTGFEIVINLLGLYGGLTIIIERLVVPLLLVLIFRCINRFHRIHTAET